MATQKFIVLDCETAQPVHYDDNNAHPETALVYDLGWIVTDKDGVIYEKRSYVISNTFNQSELMASCYYAAKLPQYWEGIRNSEWEVKTFIDVWKQFKADCQNYKIKTAWAYNCLFDIQALNSTIRTYSNGFAQWFMPFGVDVKDIWRFAGDTICNTKKYVKYCRANNYMTKKGNPQTGAEIVYRYITNKNDFVERHTALADCEIELSILRKCLARKIKWSHKKAAGDYCARKINKTM